MLIKDEALLSKQLSIPTKARQGCSDQLEIYIHQVRFPSELSYLGRVVLQEPCRCQQDEAVHVVRPLLSQTGD